MMSTSSHEMPARREAAHATTRLRLVTPMDDLSDEELMRAVAAGREEAMLFVQSAEVPSWILLYLVSG